jgi:malate dehydrogenase (oxaloacetate-decarboxylating)
MAIAAAHALAEYAFERGIDIDNIVPTMDETEVFAKVAAAVAMQAVTDGVARESYTWDEVYQKAMYDINQARNLCNEMMENGFISKPPLELIQRVFKQCLSVFQEKV